MNHQYPTSDATANLQGNTSRLGKTNRLQVLLQVSIKRRQMSRQKSFESLLLFRTCGLAFELSSGPKKRIWNMSDYPPVHRNIQIGARFLGIGDSSSTTAKLRRAIACRSLG